MPRTTRCARWSCRWPSRPPSPEWELERYGEATLNRLQLFAATRRVVELKGRLQRLNPVKEEAAYSRTMAELFQLEATARACRERGISEL